MRPGRYYRVTLDTVKISAEDQTLSDRREIEELHKDSITYSRA
jgi:hypothetical protein